MSETFWVRHPEPQYLHIDTTCPRMAGYDSRPARKGEKESLLECDICAGVPI